MAYYNRPYLTGQARGHFGDNNWNIASQGGPIFIERGRSTHREDANRELIEAARDGSEDRARAMVQHHRAEAFRPDINGWTPLHHACASPRGNLGVVRTLVKECGANVDKKTNGNETALDLAIRCHGASSEIANFLRANQTQTKVTSPQPARTQPASRSFAGPVSTFVPPSASSTRAAASPTCNELIDALSSPDIHCALSTEPRYSSQERNPISLRVRETPEQRRRRLSDIAGKHFWDVLDDATPSYEFLKLSREDQSTVDDMVSEEQKRYFRGGVPHESWETNLKHQSLRAAARDDSIRD